MEGRRRQGGKDCNGKIGFLLRGSSNCGKRQSTEQLETLSPWLDMETSVGMIG